MGTPWPFEATFNVKEEENDVPQHQTLHMLSSNRQRVAAVSASMLCGLALENVLRIAIVADATSGHLQNQWVRDRLLLNTGSWETDVYPFYSAEEFWMIFRMTKDTFEWFCMDVFKSFGFEGQKGPNWRVMSLQRRVAIFFARLASSASESTIGQQFHCDQSTVNVIVHEGLHIIKEHWSDLFLAWPVGEEARRISEAFEEYRGFPNVIAAIDGTHIPIQKPSLGGHKYFNYKQFHSINCLAAVDLSGRFLSLDIGVCGSFHDNRVLKMSNLGRRIESGQLQQQGYWLLGDIAFHPSKSWMMCPYKRERGQLSPQQRHFNYVLSATRIIVERTFGQLKGRWRILLSRMQSDLDTIVQMVGVCCTLHNMLLHRNEPVDMCWIEQQRIVLAVAVRAARTGQSSEQVITTAGLNELDAVAIRTEAEFLARFNNDEDNNAQTGWDNNAQTGWDDGS